MQKRERKKSEYSFKSLLHFKFEFVRKYLLKDQNISLGTSLCNVKIKTYHAEMHTHTKVLPMTFIYSIAYVFMDEFLAVVVGKLYVILE